MFGGFTFEGLNNIIVVSKNIQGEDIVLQPRKHQRKQPNITYFLVLYCTFDEGYNGLLHNLTLTRVAYYILKSVIQT